MTRTKRLTSQRPAPLASETDVANLLDNWLAELGDAADTLQAVSDYLDIATVPESMVCVVRRELQRICRDMATVIADFRDA